ncbi:hypothetical protein JBL43_19890 [Aureibaculum sp. A20]|uniref:Uncharacterized protein n=1 Tax=Aureibaculum flavum TaxID=2795986 RepID=A0ABS0WX00_9FLAO|nr:hypothetical protein [Aureibaculum flavum]MBJ2176520.1 hypothetical protein [Aureibaculum flavum]
MIEIKKSHLIIFVVVLIIMFFYSIFSFKKSLRDFIKAPYDDTEVDIFFGIIAMIILPIIILTLYLLGEFDNYIIK